MSYQEWKPVSYIITGDTISLNFIGVPPYSMRRPSENEKRAAKFDELKVRIKNAIESGTQEEWDEIKAIFLPSTSIAQLLEAEATTVFGSDKIELHNGKYYYRGLVLKNFLVDKIESLIVDAEENNLEKNIMLQPLCNFLENLLANPSKRSLEELYRFVQHTKMPVTEDGCLLAYKIIRGDYTDKYTGKMDNHPGKTVEMLRSAVDDNAGHTCSAGLHFCSWNYARGFFNNPLHDRMVAIKINPRDVVSIPIDYNNEKGRCCKYTVAWEIPMAEAMERDVLGMTA